MLSILVTYYNQEKYVSRSLDSIFSQNLQESFEVLVGDDGSQDGTCKIVNEYIEKYPGQIKLFIQPRDLNKKYSSVERASANRLNIFSKAQGEYICFLDGDDSYCDFDWMQDSINYLRENKHITGVAHNYREVFDTGKIVNHDNLWNKEFIKAKDYCRYLYTHTGTCVFRNPFNKKEIEELFLLKSFDDNDITIYFLNYGDLLYKDEVVYNYYQNENSIWTSASDLERNLINAIDYEILKKIIHKYHFQLFMKYYYILRSVFQKRRELEVDSFLKYKSQCCKNGILIHLLNWKKETVFTKMRIHCLFCSLFLKYAAGKIVEKIFRIGKR